MHMMTCGKFWPIQKFQFRPIWGLIWPALRVMFSPKVKCLARQLHRCPLQPSFATCSLQLTVRKNTETSHFWLTTEGKQRIVKYPKIATKILMLKTDLINLCNFFAMSCDGRVAIDGCNEHPGRSLHCQVETMCNGSLLPLYYMPYILLKFMIFFLYIHNHW